MGALSCAVFLATLAVGRVDVELYARALAPGEAVRVVVRFVEPLERPTVEFQGRDLFLVPLDDSRRVWSGWEAIGLDEPSHALVIDVRGRTVEDQAIAGSVETPIESRDFPTERLEVEADYVEPPPDVARRLEEERELLRGIYATRRDGSPVSEPFAAPVPGEPTSVFGTRRIFNGAPRDPHPGLDLRAAEGTPVAASGPGVVALARELYYSGGTVIVDHGGGLFTLYAHLSRIDVDVGRGVARGQPLGLSGSTGRVTGPHLHWGAKIGARPFDPRSLLDPALFADR